MFSRIAAPRMNRGRVASAAAAPVQLMVFGNSLAMGFNSTGTVGYRKDIGYYIQNDGLRIDMVGPFSTGTMPDPDHCAQSGASSATILSNVLSALGAGSPTRQPRLLIGDMGINDVANIGTGGVAAAATVYANLQTIQNAAMVLNPRAQILFVLMSPVQPATTGDTEVPLFNNEFTKAGGYRDKWNSNGAWGSALYPNNKLELFDISAALGGAWDTTLYGGDRLHFADPGWALINPAIMTLLRTSSIVTLRGIAPALNALSAIISSPSSGSNVTYGVVTNITGTVSRAQQDVAVTVKKGSTTLGTATVDKYTGAWTYAWTPVVGDLGAQTINVTVTDNINSDTANATGVPVTVVAPAAYDVPASSIITSVTVLRDWFAGAGVTVATGVSNWVDQVNSGSAAQATGSLQPAYTASDATLNNRATIRGDGVDDYLNDTALNLPAPGTTNIWIHIVFKPRTWTSGDHIFGCNVTAYRFGQLAGATPQHYFSNGTISAQISPTLNTWQRGEIFLSNSTSDYLKIGATTVTGTNLGNTDPAAGFFLFARNVAGYADVDIARIIITQGKPTAGEISDLDTRLSSYYNNIPAV